MGTALSVFVFGISFGLILFLLAAGLSLTMGLMRILNLAHGALYMFGGFVGLAVAKYAHNYWAGLVAGAVCTGIIGLIMETGFLRRLYKQEASQVLLTIGFTYILINIAQWSWGTYPLSGIAPGILSGYVPIGNVTIPLFRFFIIGVGLLMAVLLWLFQARTRVGAIVRAGMDNREVVGTVGINLKVVFTGIFALGSVVAGLCGTLGAPITGVNLGVGWDALLLALIVVVIGGTGSIQGALLGGIVIGLLDAFGKAYFPTVAYFIVYVALIVILLIRPSGLLGRRMPAGGAETLERAAGRGTGPEEVEAGLIQIPRWRLISHKYLPYIVMVIVLALVPPLGGSYFQTMLTKVLILAMFAMSLDLTMGYTGLISFGHAAFLGMAGYSVAILLQRTPITSFWLVALIALVLTAILALVIGYISLRVSGIYFLLVTMALGQLLTTIAISWFSLTGGTNGMVIMSRPQLGFDVRWTNLKFYYLVFAFFIVCFIVLQRIVRSPFGSTLVGIRENEPRMRSLGFNTWALKYVAVVVGALFAGLAGVFFAFFSVNMVPSYLSLEWSALPMLMVIMGGPATLYGPCIGAAVIVFAEHYSRTYLPDRWPLVLGAVFVLCVMLLRGGFAQYLSLLWSKTGFVRPKAAQVRESAGTEVEA
ncbi:MAG: ABC transporter permease [Actinobacteria bacterium]|nr:ABC transporter permease [Actinomycetota bacterium]